MALSWRRGRPLPLAIRTAVRRPAGCRWRLIRLSRIHSPLEDPFWETKDPDGASRGCRGLCFRFGSACLCAIFEFLGRVDVLGRVTAEICCKRRLSQAVSALVAESRYTQKSQNCNSLLHPPTRTASQNRTDKTFRSKIGMDFGCAPAAPRSLSARNNAFPGKSHCIVHASPVASAERTHTDLLCSARQRIVSVPAHMAAMQVSQLHAGLCGRPLPIRARPNVSASRCSPTCDPIHSRN